jgi:thioredoxin 2
MSTGRSFIVRCSACRTKNRIPADKMGMTARCGKCKAAVQTRDLMVGEPVIVTDASFEAQVLKSPLPVLLDCWAAWCQPCQTVSPIVHEIAAQHKGRLKVGKLNTEQNPVTTNRYQILSLPTLLIFDGGQVKDALAGAFPKNIIMQKIGPYIS